MSDQPNQVGRRSKKNRGPMLTLLMSPSYWHVAAFEFFSAWFLTRPKFQLLVSLPFVIGILSFWILAIFNAPISSTEEMQDHFRRAILAKSAGKNIAFDIACRRILAMELTEENRFRVAMTLAAGNEEEKAKQQLQLIAPEDGLGYGEAHLWIAMNIIAKSKSDQDNPSPRLLHHARAAYELLPASPEAQALWGQVLSGQGKKLEALGLLEQAAEKLPEVNLLAAQLHTQLGNPENAKRYLDQAEQYFRSLIVQDKENASARQSLIEVSILKRDFKAALDIAEEGFRDSPSLLTKQSLLRTLAFIYESLDSDKRFGVEGLPLILRALEVEPRDLNALQMLIRFVVLQDEQQWSSTQKQMELKIAEGRAGAMFQLILAIGLSDHANQRLSLFHLKQSVAEEGSLLSLSGNVALAAIETDPPELKFAENWLAVLFEAFPDRPEFLEVRAKLFIEEGKYDQAINDLKLCLTKVQPADRIRKLLGEAYEKMGQPELAKQYLDSVSPSTSPQVGNDKAVTDPSSIESNK
jgi:tetratricopeptide (TPR) repeat protein